MTAQERDRRLVDECIKGSQMALENFVVRFSRLVYHTVYTTLLRRNLYCEPMDLEDLHSEVFLSLFKERCGKLKQYRGLNQCSLATWLRTIAAHRTLDFLKKQRRLGEVAVPVHDELPVAKTPSSHVSPHDLLERKERKLVIQELIQGLPREDQLLLKLCYEEDLPPKEASKTLNISLAALYSRHNSIKKKILKSLRTRTDWPLVPVARNTPKYTKVYYVFE
jgi:RNA polymerase sigma factor (sigma-70 family)